MHDFELLRDEEISELNIRALFYRHRTGCEVVSLINEDENKVFGINFPHRPPIRPASPIFSSIRCCAARANIRSKNRL